MLAAVDRLTRDLETQLVEHHADGSADAVVLLQARPREWKSAVRRLSTGRRLVFAVEATVPVADVLRHVGRRGATVTALVPYGGLRGGTLQPRDHPRRWERLMSWLAVDEDLAALARLLEIRWVSRLPPALAGRLMVVADKGAGSAQRPDAFVFDALTVRDGALVDEIERLSHRLRPRYFLFLVVASLEDGVPGFEPALLLTPGRLDQYAVWQETQRLDDEVTTLARSWSAGCDERWRDGLDLTVAVDYELVRQLLERHHRRFEGVPR